MGSLHSTLPNPESTGIPGMDMVSLSVRISSLGLLAGCAASASDTRLRPFPDSCSKNWRVGGAPRGGRGPGWLGDGDGDEPSMCCGWDGELPWQPLRELDTRWNAHRNHPKRPGHPSTHMQTLPKTGAEQRMLPRPEAAGTCLEPSVARCCRYPYC